MADQPSPRDIEFVIARGEALVSQARGMVAQWEQSLVELGITPEVARQLKDHAGTPDLHALVKARQQAASNTSTVGPAEPARDAISSTHPMPPGPSLQAARRAVRRLRHV